MTGLGLQAWPQECDPAGRRLGPHTFFEIVFGAASDLRGGHSELFMHFPTATGRAACVTIIHHDLTAGDQVFYRVNSATGGPDPHGDLTCYATVRSLQGPLPLTVTVDAYSAAARGGEQGSMPLDAFLGRVTGAEFEQARSCGWPDISEVLAGYVSSWTPSRQQRRAAARSAARGGAAQ